MTERRMFDHLGFDQIAISFRAPGQALLVPALFSSWPSHPCTPSPPDPRRHHDSRARRAPHLLLPVRPPTHSFIFMWTPTAALLALYATTVLIAPACAQLSVSRLQASSHGVSGTYVITNVATGAALHWDGDQGLGPAHGGGTPLSLRVCPLLLFPSPATDACARAGP